MKRTAQERKRLAPELEAFARSDETRLRIKRPHVDRGTVDDPREGYAIAGVANRDARSVYDARASELEKLWSGGTSSAEQRELVGERLLDVRRLTLWRARRVTGFAAFAEQVLGMKLAEAEELSDAAAKRLGEPLKALTEREVAMWLRTEAGLYEGDPKARAFIRVASGKPVLSLAIETKVASLGLTGAGARHAPLARVQREQEGRPVETPEPEPDRILPAAAAGARLLRRHAERQPLPSVGASDERDYEQAEDQDEEAEAPVAERPRAERPRAERPPETRERPRMAERPRFQDKRERPRFQDTRERPAAAERPRFEERGERARPQRFEAQGERPAFQKRGAAGKAGDRPAFQQRGAGGERPAFQKRGAGADRPAFQKRDGGGDRPAFQKRGAAGADRPAFQKRGAAGASSDRPAFQKRGAAAGGKKQFFKSTPGGAGKSFDKGKGFSKGKGFGERKPFGNAGQADGPRGEKKPFKKKHDDEG